MINVERAIHIDALPAAVWSVVADVDRWPEWTPTLKRIERDPSRPFGAGSEARLWLKGVLGASLWRVTDYDAERHTFTWESRAPGLHSVGGHLVEPDGAGSRVKLRVTQNGIGSMLLRPLIGRVSRRNMQLEAESLRRRCEQRVAAS